MSQPLSSNFFFMRESSFVKINKPRWEEFEKVVKNQQQAPPINWRSYLFKSRMTSPFHAHNIQPVAPRTT